MSLNWNWNDKIGEITEVRGDREYTFNMYECNGLVVWCHEWKANGKELYEVAGFFADEEHAKNCLGLNKKYSEKNIYEDTFKKIKIYKCKTGIKFLNLIIKANFNNPLQIEIINIPF